MKNFVLASAMLRLMSCAILLSCSSLAFSAPVAQDDLASRAANARSDFQKLYDAYEQLQTSHVDVKGNDDPAYGRRKVLEDKMAALEPEVTEAYNRMTQLESELRAAKPVRSESPRSKSGAPRTGSQVAPIR